MRDDCGWFQAVPNASYRILAVDDHPRARRMLATLALKDLRLPILQESETSEIQLVLDDVSANSGSNR